MTTGARNWFHDTVKGRTEIGFDLLHLIIENEK
jgi:hypothetical protein